ncbi:MAG: radical SAM protein [Lentisphaeria bacterium]|nr:radical SAM protein [Lentisphaeria bacterium]
MFLRLAKNSYVRFYGNYTYLFNQLDNSDQLLEDAAPFFEMITREGIEKKQIIDHICSLYSVGRDVVERDFDALMAPLIENKFLIASETNKKDDSDPSFSYDIPDPKTAFDWGSPADNDLFSTPETIMLDYFQTNPTLFALHCDITGACTERCVHCYIPEHRVEHIPYPILCQVMRDFKKMGGLKIFFSGGECMLHPNFKEIVRYAKDLDLSILLLSNLTLCDDEMTDFLKTMNIGSIQVSLYSMAPGVHDAITQLPGSHKKTLDAIFRLRNANIPLSIACPTMKLNFSKYREVLEFGKKMKIHATTDFLLMARSDHSTDNLKYRLSIEETAQLMDSMLDFGYDNAIRFSTDDEFNALLEASEDRAERQICGAGTSTICLNSNGEYYPCSGFQDYPVGNCYDSSLRDVWENAPKLKYIRGLRGKDIPECIHCQNRSFCSVCLVRNFNETGDMLKPNKHFCRIADLNRKKVLEYRKMHCHEIR